MRSRISSVDREPVEVLEGDVFLAGGGLGVQSSASTGVQ